MQTLKRRRQSLRHRRRAASTLLELLISSLLVSVAIGMALPTFSLVKRQQRAADQQQEALAAAQNIMDQLQFLPWNELAQAAEAITLPDYVQRQLTEPRLTINVADADDVLAAKRVLVELSWQDLAGQRLPPVRLVAWRFRTGGAE